ncbi:MULTISPECIES: acetyl-CoA C-acyltransferase [unclassified Gordonia (in: high G+C Gram-positive bacteria)]|uniref:acetyl-CoA C-acyltransferase n=1 Tax=unclassified Gordonia (in: high G+C Gram-positive bacteria) TaxID=2657482 RepID=UPI00071E55B2|nr:MULTISPECIES: acetyl-CoA C-acyltransferase [unclassified Gordonia (in: high G+C Gram-positive bacteria)]KSU54521.1 acetyl-CoA acetyltransferase [Gordonia sp. SGD-V-85]MCX2754898.1 acetyl-CoA C-acyltransferase [Gordonia sp. 4N]MDT0222080.1 acetyl-CoA C-acyltransferase [Gordonia sp. AC31]SCC54077.1 acetyl-CoA acyltransferase [Gordonia sp. v-85]
MRSAVIVDAVRTPIGKGKPTGALHDVHPVDLLAHSLRAVVDRSGVDPELVDDVITGVVSQVGEQSFNIARRALLAAGYPESVPGVSVDRQCGSGQQAIAFAAQGIIAGTYDIAVAAGVESMSRIPMGSAVAGTADLNGRAFGERYPQGLVGQGISAELIAARWDISRREIDEFSLRSHDLAATATKNGLFDDELAPIAGLTSDEGIRLGGNLDDLARLRPAYYDEAIANRFPEIDWRITAASASQISDGSSAVLLMSEEKAAELGLRPRARVHTIAVAGDDPLLMLTGIIPATRKALLRSGLRVEDIDLFEVNEAFAPVVLAWSREFGVDVDRVNVNGGAIALGHPLGASGARLATTGLNALEQRGGRYLLQTMCEAGGLANATIYERLG